MNLEQVKTNALEEVNKIRRLAGMETLSELPTGFRGGGCRCPISRALDLNIEVFETSLEIYFMTEKLIQVFDQLGYEKIEGWRTKRRLSQPLAEFVSAFEGGKFYDLEE